MPTNNDLKRWYGDNTSKSTEDFARMYDINTVRRAAAITAWNQEVVAGSVTPDITLPTPSGTEVEEITYIFTAATANASFTAPAGWKVCDDNGTAGLSAGNTLSYNDLTVGSIYECSFKPISTDVIRLVKCETKTA